MDAKNHCVHGQLKRKPAYFTHIFSVSTIGPLYYCSKTIFGRICTYDVGLTLEIFCGVWVFNLKSTQHSITWRWAVLCKKQDGGWIKVGETFSGNSLKEVLSIDITFNPCYFSWDSPFNITIWKWKEATFFISSTHSTYILYCNCVYVKIRLCLY